MLKFGITDIPLDLERIRKILSDNKKHVSITLYNKIRGYVKEDELAQRILLFFSDERGAYKRTYQKRFEIFDQQAIHVLKDFFKNSHEIIFHDMAVSDGRTALDFFEKMQTEFPMIDYYASDYNPNVYVIKKGKLKVTLSQTDKVLEIMFPPFVFNKAKRDSYRHYPLNHIIRFFVEKFCVHSLVAQYRKGAIQAKEISLFAPKVVQKTQKDSRFRVGQHDLLKPCHQKVDIIRTMNVLNPAYFTDADFKKVISNLYDGLKENGLLITGSNQEAGSIVHGGIYQKKTAGFAKIFNSGDGSPVDALFIKNAEV